MFLFDLVVCATESCSVGLSLRSVAVIVTISGEGNY